MKSSKGERENGGKNSKEVSVLLNQGEYGTSPSREGVVQGRG